MTVWELNSNVLVYKEHVSVLAKNSLVKNHKYPQISFQISSKNDFGLYLAILHHSEVFLTIAKGPPKGSPGALREALFFARLSIEYWVLSTECLVSSIGYRVSSIENEVWVLSTEHYAWHMRYEVYSMKSEVFCIICKVFIINYKVFSIRYPALSICSMLKVKW